MNILLEFSLLHPIPDLSSPSPEEVVFPEDMGYLTPSWMLTCDIYSGGQVWVNGKRVKENFLSPEAVKALKVSGDIQCGLLHVYISVPRLNLIGQK